uniref:Uncharacterized protein n=1 Tax=Macrostomum lignano TaxID=282301 RepID=A0A1I8FD36_9PLAT
MHTAYKHAEGKKIDGRRVLVDAERARTIKNWRPRRLVSSLNRFHPPCRCALRADLPPPRSELFMDKHLFNLKLAAKDLERNAKQCDRSEAAERGSMDAAQIHAENAIRQRNQALSYRRMGARIDALWTTRMANASTLSTPQAEVDSLIQQSADEAGIELRQQLPDSGKAAPVGTSTVSSEQDELTQRLGRLSGTNDRSFCGAIHLQVTNSKL